MKTIAYSLGIIFCLLAIDHSAAAQSARSKKLYKDAIAEYANRDYRKSLSYCLEILGNDPDFTEARLLTARNYYELNEFDKTLATLEKINVESSEDVVFLRAITYKSQGDYQKAIELLDDYIKNARLVNQQERAKIERDGAVLAIQSLEEDNPNFAFENIGDIVNTPGNEVSVAIVEGPKKILVSRELDNEYKEGENIKYLSTPEWMKVNDGDEFEFLNTPEYEGAGVFDKKNEVLYFTKIRGESNKRQIYSSVKVKGIWQQAKPLGMTINMAEYNSQDPMLSAGSDTLFYSTDRRGGIGNYDLWYSVKNEDGTWSDAVNLGAPINTSEDEVAPFINSDGTFYFASEGHAGFGKLDIYYVNGLEGKREIHNLGAPFNSPLDDSHLVLSSNRGFLVSNRKGGKGGYDVYTFEQEYRQEKPTAESETGNIIYSVIFTSGLYDMNPKFIRNDYSDYVALSSEALQQIRNQADESLAEMSNRQKKKVIEEDKILLASLGNDHKYFIERLVASIYEDESSPELKISEEDMEKYIAMSPEEKRETYRLIYAMYDDFSKQFSGKKEEKAAEEEPEIAEDLPENEEETKSNVQQTEELVNEEISTDKLTSASGENMMELEMPERQEEADEKFTNLLGVDQSVRFYQNLPFSDKKRVDRIMAIRLVNEKYVLAPDLSTQDRSYYYSLSDNEKAIIERLKMYFRSWNKDQELSNLREDDLNYLSSLDQQKRARVARIIVRRGIGIDSDNFVRFSGRDWSEYKSYSEEEIRNIKEVANLLRKNDQMFDVALAYAGPDYQLNNNLAAIRPDQPAQMAVHTSTDPEVAIEGPEQQYETVYFDPGAYRLRKEAMVALNDLVNVYRSNPQILIGLKAYSGDYESSADNVQLSSQRIRSAKTYLVNQGIPDIKIQSEPKSISANASLQDLSSLQARKLDISLINYETPIQSEYTTYMIQPGNTLYSLAKANHISVEELKSLNGLNSNLIIAYEPLRVKKTATLDPDYMMSPPSQFATTDSPQTAEAPEDTIEEREKKTEEDRGGETMVFDVTKDEQPKEVIHIVQKGEKIKDIAEEYDVEVEEIVKWNELKRAKVKKGQVIKIIQ